MFDKYALAINPQVKRNIITILARLGSNNSQDNYKVTCFIRDETTLNLDGRSLSKSATHTSNANYRVSDGALYWHFEQAVLKNMRGPAAEKWPD